MPFGEYADFDDCVAKNKDKSDPAAYCATIEKKIKGAAIQEDLSQNDRLFISAFLLDPTVNLNDWGVVPDTLDSNISSFIGKPLTLYENTGNEIDADRRVTGKLDHPPLGDELPHILKAQESYRIGTIVDVVKKDTAYNAIIEITDKNAKEAIQGNKLALYVSPALYQLDAEPDTAMKSWTGVHLAVVDDPAFGVKKAQIKDKCAGEAGKCIAMMKQASYGCSFCAKKVLNLHYANNTSDKTIPNTNNTMTEPTPPAGVSVEEHAKVVKELELLRAANADLKTAFETKLAAIEKENTKTKMAAVLKGHIEDEKTLNERVDFFMSKGFTVDEVAKEYRTIAESVKIKVAALTKSTGIQYGGVQNEPTSCDNEYFVGVY